MIRKIALITTSLLLFAGLLALVGFAQVEEQNAQYTGLDVDVTEVDGMFFVDAAGIKDAIFANDSIAGTFFADLNLAEVSEWVRAIPAVDRVVVYPGLDKIMHVRATQRKPIARLHSSADIEDIYIDSNGESLALSPYFTARVPVIHATSIEAAQPAISFIETIRHDQFWWAFCDQLTVKADGKLEVIPRIGNARIAFDSNENLERQLDKLFTFYHEQIRRGSLNDYKRIDLSFHEQVVAQRYY